jgi:hypothetical protein
VKVRIVDLIMAHPPFNEETMGKTFFKDNILNGK